jgi:hypothetical protein
MRFDKPHWVFCTFRKNKHTLNPTSGQD